MITTQYDNRLLEIKGISGLRKLINNKYKHFKFNPMEGKKPIDKKWKQIKEKFSITRFIGSGSCGEVARVKHRETKEIYAVKLVKFD